MKKINADISIGALLFWIIVLVLFYTQIFSLIWPIWLVGFAPIYFVTQILILKMSTYVLVGNSIVIKQYFKEIRIDFDKIKSYEIKDSSLIKSLFTGLPRKTIRIKYNKYDSIEILTVNNEIVKILPDIGSVQ